MTLNRRPRLLPLLLLMMSVPLAVGTTDARAALSEEEGHEEAGQAGGHHRNHLALFLGNTSEGEENGFTVGIDYEHRITSRIGVGALFDYASGDFRTTVLGAAAFYRAVAELKLLGAVGAERHDNHNELLYRLGILYAFRFGDRWIIAPTVQVDFVDGETLTLVGVNFGWGF